MDYLNKIEEYALKGWFVMYEIINQVENGYEEDVDDGDIPLCTYKFHIYKESTKYPFDEMNVNHLKEGYDWAFKAIEYASMDSKNKERGFLGLLPDRI